MNDKLDAAIAYLRSRNIYVVDPNNKFVPTGVASTDVAATWRRYEIQVLGIETLNSYTNDRPGVPVLPTGGRLQTGQDHQKHTQDLEV